MSLYSSDKAQGPVVVITPPTGTDVTQLQTAVKNIAASPGGAWVGTNVDVVEPLGAKAFFALGAAALLGYALARFTE